MADKDIYEVHLARLHDLGIATARHQCPHCEIVLETQLPAKEEGPHDAAVICPYCRGPFQRMVHPNGQVAVVGTPSLFTR